MVNRIGETVKIVSGSDAFDFETKLNSVLNSLNSKGARYTMQLEPSAGLIAYIRISEEVSIPENVAEEYFLAGERHRCDEFYERLDRGELKLIEVG